MLIKTPQNCEYFRALDETMICELLHPQRDIKDLEMNFSMAHAILKPGESFLSHKMKTSVEIYYILEGKGLMHIENEKEGVEPNQIIYIPPNSAQWIENRGYKDLKLLMPGQSSLES